MRKRWMVDLNDEQRTQLESVTRRGRAPGRKVAHARVLLLASEGLTDDEIATATGTCVFPGIRTAGTAKKERLVRCESYSDFRLCRTGW